MSPPQLEHAKTFCRVFFERVAASDVDLHTVGQWAGLIANLLEFMQQRDAGQTCVRIVSPDDAPAGRSLLQVLTDDMPFLVDTVSMMVATNLQIHAVIHPVLTIARDASGSLQRIDDAEVKGVAESVMHFEIDRVADDGELQQLKDKVQAALDDVRAAVKDWSAIRERALAIADELPKRKSFADAALMQEAADFMRWVAADNFTFLGYREYEVASADGEQVLCARESSGLGILHETERSLAPRSLRSLGASGTSRSGDPIILTKTNARSHVHRPGHMDYIGVLRFDEAGKPVAEQRFLGMFSSNAYMARPQDRSCPGRGSSAIPIPESRCAMSLKPCRATNCFRAARMSCSIPVWAFSTFANAPAPACSCVVIAMTGSTPARSSCRASVSTPRCASVSSNC
jgi:glutamate dehydrogenase